MAIKQNAVDNFVSTIGDQTEAEATANLERNARSYRWNLETVTAIESRIAAYFARIEYWAQFRPDSKCNCGVALGGLGGSFIFGIESGEGSCRECGWPARAHHRFSEDDVVEKVRAYLPEFVEEV